MSANLEHSEWPYIPPEQDRLLLQSIEMKLYRTLRDIRQTLIKPYELRLQQPLEIRFRTSVGRVIAIYVIEGRLERLSKPKFYHYRDEWVERRETAVGRGYLIQPFEECIPPDKLEVFNHRT